MSGVAPHSGDPVALSRDQAAMTAHVSAIPLRRQPFPRYWMAVAPFGALTALLYVSGGATNPFVFLYPLQLALAAMLLEARSTWALVAITSICFAALTRFYVPLQLPQGGVERLFELHIIGMWICFVLDAVLLVVESGRTRRRPAVEAIERLRAAGALIIGANLTKYKLDTSEYGYRYYEAYDENRVALRPHELAVGLIKRSGT